MKPETVEQFGQEEDVMNRLRWVHRSHNSSLCLSVSIFLSLILPELSKCLSIIIEKYGFLGDGMELCPNKGRLLQQTNVGIVSVQAERVVWPACAQLTMVTGVCDVFHLSFPVLLHVCVCVLARHACTRL